MAKNNHPLANPRHIAWQCLVECDKTHRYLQDLLWEKTQDLSAVDRRLAWTLALGTWRNKCRLGATLDAFRNPQIKMRPSLAWLAKLSFHQLHALDRVPHHAAVYEMVELAKKHEGEGAGKFLNALLQRFIREGLVPLSSDPTQAMAMEFCIPTWLIAKWLKQESRESLHARLSKLREVPSQWIRINPARIELSQAQQELGLSDAKTFRSRWIEAGNAVSNILRSPLFLQGKISVQNPAADLVVDLLQLQGGLRVWDACAAPGGKSALMLERQPDISLWATDVNEKRLEDLQDLRERLHTPDFKVQVFDLLGDENPPETFDRILLDVPCSNLGVLQRRPEVLDRIQRTTIPSLAKNQMAMLERAKNALALNGILVYATCSPEPEETTAIVQTFLLKNLNFQLLPIDRETSLQVGRQSGMLFAGNDELGFDGFFAAALQRIS